MIKKNLTLFIFIFSLFISATAMAASLTVSPSIQNYTIGSNLTLNVNWNVTTTGNGGGTASSNTGTYTFAQNQTSVIGPGGISLTAPSLTSGTFSIPESFQIPAAILATAQQNNFTTIYYYRDFIAGAEGQTGPAYLRINLKTPNIESKLKISRESLRFSDNTSVKLIKPKTRISALAELKYTGTGLLDAFWEVASPMSTTGVPLYTRLRTVRSYLGAGGRAILRSPPLPATANGQYLVRLQIRKTTTNPNGVEFTTNLPAGLPVLRYTVSQQGEGGATYALPPIKTSSPLKNTLLNASTRFRWQAVKGAKAYQLELYLPDLHKRPSADDKNLPLEESLINNKSPATGLLVPAKKTSLSLSALSRDTLRHNQIYYWRIIAISNDGQVLTTSPLKTIRTP